MSQCQVFKCDLQIYKAFSGKVSTKNSPGSNAEKAVRRFAKDLHALIDADKYMTDFMFVSWNVL